MFKASGLMVFYENMLALNNVILSCGENQIIGVFGAITVGDADKNHQPPPDAAHHLTLNSYRGTGDSLQERFHFFLSFSLLPSPDFHSPLPISGGFLRLSVI